MKNVTTNEVKLRFPSISCNEALARSCITAFAARLDPAVSEIAEIKTAVSEAVTNCIVHAYRGTVGIVELSASAKADGTLYIKIRDHGCGIEDIAKAMQPLYTSAPEEERAGLGFAVMQSFMDKVTVKSTAGKGTVVTMKKKIHSGELSEI